MKIFAINKKETKIKNKKVDDAFAWVNQCLDKIENYLIIKKKIKKITNLIM